MIRGIFMLVTSLVLVLGIVSPAAAENWYFKPAKNNQTPTTEPEFERSLEKYQGIWIGNTERKIVYLTFDNGYEEGYTDDILDVLREKDVPAAFFITGHYIKDQPKLVKRMVNEGHIVGNHSWSHPDLTKISDEKYKKELNKVEQAFEKLTGQGMDYVRPPRGIFSERSLKLAHNLGYTSVFWSFAYADWKTDSQKGADHAYRSVLKRVHPGAVMLLHTVSKDNAEALDRIIDTLRKRGYKFKSLDYLMAHRAVPNFVW